MPGEFENPTLHRIIVYRYNSFMSLEESPAVLGFGSLHEHTVIMLPKIETQSHSTDRL